jgi:hypothetical protein
MNIERCSFGTSQYGINATSEQIQNNLALMEGQQRADTPGKNKGRAMSTLPGYGTAFTNLLCAVVFALICGGIQLTAISGPRLN